MLYYRRCCPSGSSRQRNWKPAIAVGAEFRTNTAKPRQVKLVRRRQKPPGRAALSEIIVPYAIARKQLPLTYFIQGEKMELHGEEIEITHDKGRIVSTRHPPFDSKPSFNKDTPSSGSLLIQLNDFDDGIHSVQHVVNGDILEPPVVVFPACENIRCWQPHV